MTRTTLSYSFQTVWESILTYIAKHPFILVVIGFLVLQSIIISLIKRKWKIKYVAKFENDKNLTNNQFYITYYKKIQLIEIIRFILIFLLITSYTVTKNFGIMSYFSIALGAFVLTFQSYIVSIAVYLTLLRRHRIGDTVKIGHENDAVQGQIIYIKPFSIGISGITNDGQNTGELYIISNHLLIQKPIVRIDLKAENYHKSIISLRYRKEEFSMPFHEFLQILEDFLSKNLPTSSAKTVSHFKTYIGYKYKLDFEYEKEGSIHISIGIITRLRHAVDTKRMIISYVEGIKTNQHTREEIEGTK